MDIKPLPNYRAFAREMIRLCKKHNVQIIASDEGFVGIGPANLKNVNEYIYSELEFNPTSAKMAGGWEGKEPKPIIVNALAE